MSGKHQEKRAQGEAANVLAEGFGIVQFDAFWQRIEHVRNEFNQTDGLPPAIKPTRTPTMRRIIALDS